MSSSNVTNIEALELLHQGLSKFADEIRTITEELRASVVRTEEAFNHDYPSYWRKQIQLAEQNLNEAKDRLAAKTATTRIDNRPAASEERKRVRNAEKRLRSCTTKLQHSRQWSLKISRECDDLLGPMADILDHCDSILPQAASELRTLITQLRTYADQAEQS